MGVKVTIEDIKDGYKRAQRKEKEQIEAEAEKNAEIRALGDLKAQIMDMPQLSAKKKEDFSKFIDRIIEGNGEIPEENPIKEHMEALQDEAQEHYNTAEALMTQTGRQ